MTRDTRNQIIGVGLLWIFTAACIYDSHKEKEVAKHNQKVKDSWYERNGITRMV